MSTIEPYEATSQNESDSAKGSASNPYTESEFESMLDNDTWTGGYVEGRGYVGDDATIWGSGSETSDSETSCSESSDNDSILPGGISGGATTGGTSTGGGSTGTGTGTSTGTGGAGTGTSIETGTTGGTTSNSITITGKTSGISGYSYNLLMNLSGYSGEIYITSVARTPEEQAQAMLNNIKKNGVQSQLDLYAPAGDQVISVYDANLSDSENLQNMIAKILEIGPSNVSKHCADPAILNVLDVSRSRLSNANTFVTALNLAGIYNIDEPKNGCVHIEIPQ